MSNYIKNTITTNHVSLGIFRQIDADHFTSASKSSYMGIEVTTLDSQNMVYKLSQSQELNDLTLFNDNNSIAFLTTGTQNTYVKIWHFKTHKRAKIIYEDSYRTENICRIVGSKGKEYIGIYSNLFDFKILNPESGELVATFEDDQRRNEYYRFSQLKNGNLTCFATQPAYGESDDFYIYTFSLDGKIVNEQTVGTSSVDKGKAHLVCEGGYVGRNRFAIGYYTGRLSLWDVDGVKEPIYLDENNEGNVVDQIENISDTLFATSSGDSVKIWDHDTLKIVEKISLKGGGIKLKKIGENRLAMSSYKENVRIVEFN